MCICMRGITPHPCFGQGSGSCGSRVTAVSAAHTRKDSVLGERVPKSQAHPLPHLPLPRKSKGERSGGRNGDPSAPPIGLLNGVWEAGEGCALSDNPPRPTLKFARESASPLRPARAASALEEWLCAPPRRLHAQPKAKRLLFRSRAALSSPSERLSQGPRRGGRRANKEPLKPGAHVSDTSPF